MCLEKYAGVIRDPAFYCNPISEKILLDHTEGPPYSNNGIDTVLTFQVDSCVGLI
jgi:hypothetical protein